ncbi:MAG: hypothetical protein NTY17_11990 [Planctomycetia bacterium]|nr:hypothetical protein [Planctomycetia bacterium]
MNSDRRRCAFARLVLLALVAAVLAVPAVGCRRGPAKAVFTGRVTLNDEPLPQGAISFYPLDRLPSAGAVINAGSYRMEAFPGSYRVEISGSKVVGQKKNDIPDGPMVDILESIVPAEYNSASKLVQEVKLDTKTLDFKLVTPAGK